MTDERQPDTDQMRKMTQDLAEREPPDAEGSATTPTEGWSDGGQFGMSQGGGVTAGTPLDAQMAQQAHQAAQGSEGGHSGDPAGPGREPAAGEPHTGDSVYDSVPANPAPASLSPDEVQD